jgi:osomolarity two-component system phosphorelay intermediate protein YPD1
MSKDIIDESIFRELLELDEDDTHEFSKEIISGYFEQIEESIIKFKELFDKEDYVALEKLAHFIKGSSAAVGSVRLRELGNEMQHWELYTNDPKQFFSERIPLLQPALDTVKKQYDVIYNDGGILP